MTRIAVILPAAGKSSRFEGKEKKPYVNLQGRAVWLGTAELFVNRDEVCQTLLLIDPADREMVTRRYGANIAFLGIQLAEGGKERFESVANALKEVREEADLVAVHDAVRPCVTPARIDAVFAQAEKTGAAILASPVSETLKRVEDGKKIKETVPRQGIWMARTPQVFRRDWLIEAYAQRDKLSSEITDDAQLIEAMGHPVHVVEDDSTNLKITKKADLALAEAILTSRPKPKADGPAHPFAEEDMWS